MVAAAPALLIASAAASVVGTGLAVAGQLQAAEARAASDEANAAIASQQAQIARDQATQERQRAAVEAENFARDARRRQGARISAISASGITLSGSAMDVLQDAALEDAQSRALILHEGETRARAHLAGASIEEMTAAEFQRQASAERRAAPIGAASTIIGGAAQTGFQVERSPAFRRVAGGRV
jgi:hypothetical protein